MKGAGLFGQIPSEVWQIDWNVNSQTVGSSEATLKYLVRYVFRVAISNSRILKIENRTVFIRYRKSQSHRLRPLPLEVMEFIRRFLQHVLPSGFMKVRYYGFNVPLPNTNLELWQPITCPACGGTLRLRFLLLPLISPLSLYWGNKEGMKRAICGNRINKNTTKTRLSKNGKTPP
jgi:hypothetical protein